MPVFIVKRTPEAPEPDFCTLGLFYREGEHFPRLKNHHGQVAAPRRSSWFQYADETITDQATTATTMRPHPKHISRFSRPTRNSLLQPKQGGSKLIGDLKKSMNARDLTSYLPKAS